MTDNSLTRSNLPWVIVIFLLGFIAGIVLLLVRGQTLPAPIVITPPPPTPTSYPTQTPGPLRVYISGAVTNPAVYELSHGAILEEVVKAAGGFTKDADRSAVNLALILEDGMHIHVPVPGADPIITIDNPNAEEPGGGLININTATLEELDTLPGIGPSTAQKIIDYRQANGPFGAIEEIDNVPGIGPAKLEQIRDYITVQ